MSQKEKNEDNILNIFKKHKNVFLSVLILWFIFSVGTIIIASDFSFALMPKMSLANLGVFGDSFNVLTSLFTGLAFAGVIISVILQTTELRDARVEFRRQAEALELQQVDNKFFQMLDELNSLINRLKISKDIDGLAVFEFLVAESKKYFKDKENFQIDFKAFNDRYDTTFKYYFINLYQVIKYVDRNLQVEEKDKDNDDKKIKKIKKQEKEYINIIRAQQTKNQLKLLFLNGIGIIEFSGDNYKKLIEKYALFEHIKYSELFIYAYEVNTCDDIEELRNLYDDAAFKNNNIELVDSLLIKYEKEAFGNNEDLIKIWENRKKLLQSTIEQEYK